MTSKTLEAVVEGEVLRPPATFAAIAGVPFWLACK